MKFKNLPIVILLVFLFVFVVASKVEAQLAPTLNEEQTREWILEQINILQGQLLDILADKYSFGKITANNRKLVRGMEGEDVRDLQNSLAENPDIYPEALVTGYFGPLTEAAVKRFQVKYIGKEPTGEVDTITDDTIKAFKVAKLKDTAGKAYSVAFYGFPKPAPDTSTSTPDVATSTPDGTGSGQTKVVICHVPPGNPSNAKTISIGEPALSTHLAKGSYKGECKSVSVVSN